jgi:hypothetical protein
MTVQAGGPRPRGRMLWGWIGGLAAVAVLFTAAVKYQDENNGFCIACHLHQQIYDRMVGTPSATLAAAHFHQHGRPTQMGHHPERCFTCHSGEHVSGWTQVTALSAWDAARWVAGDRHEPTHMRLALSNDACLKCHAADIGGHTSADETEKFHELADHRQVKTACITCHVVHSQGEASKHFLDDAVVREQCTRCHRNFDSM